MFSEILERLSALETQENKKIAVLDERLSALESRNNLLEKENDSLKERIKCLEDNKFIRLKLVPPVADDAVFEFSEKLLYFTGFQVGHVEMYDSRGNCMNLVDNIPIEMSRLNDICIVGAAGGGTANLTLFYPLYIAKESDGSSTFSIEPVPYGVERILYFREISNSKISVLHEKKFYIPCDTPLFDSQPHSMPSFHPNDTQIYYKI
jgi:hypothetical protein